MNTQTLEHYTEHSLFTHPGSHANLIDALPADIPYLMAAINGILIHLWKVRKHMPDQLKTRPYEVFTRRNADLLQRILDLDSQPLNVTRPKEKRFIGDCRHFALLACTIFRERGIPARARCGFATYLEDTFNMDHWICEYWHTDDQRWVMIDPDLQMDDVSPDQFMTGANAWQMCRTDPVKSMTFGFGEGDGERGMWTVRANLVRDFAALNGFESVSGDGWGLAMADDNEVSPDDMALLDDAAALAMSDDRFEARQQRYENSKSLRAPAKIQHYDYVVSYKWRTVDWVQE